jgi:hypothetical protein
MLHERAAIGRRGFNYTIGIDKKTVTAYIFSIIQAMEFAFNRLAGLITPTFSIFIRSY